MLFWLSLKFWQFSWLSLLSIGITDVNHKYFQFIILSVSLLCLSFCLSGYVHATWRSGHSEKLLLFSFFWGPEFKLRSSANFDILGIGTIQRRISEKGRTPLVVSNEIKRVVFHSGYLYKATLDRVISSRSQLCIYHMSYMCTCFKSWASER